MKILLSILIMSLFFSGCANIRDNGKMLGLAGQSAAQSLIDQTDSARNILYILPELWGVHDALVCSKTPPGTEMRKTCLNNSKNIFAEPRSKDSLFVAQQSLLDIMNKRIVAEQALRDAYKSFTNLAIYDAGAETKLAIEDAFEKINALTAAAAKIAPQGVVLREISSTFTSVASNLGNFIASARQDQLILIANDDLHNATKAMIATLAVERDKALSNNLFIVLGKESDELLKTFVQSGLISPRDVLAPLLAQIAPGFQMVKKTLAENNDIILTAASISLYVQSMRKQQAIALGYDAALATLKALSSEHAKLKNKQDISPEVIVDQVERIQTRIKNIQQHK